MNTGVHFVDPIQPEVVTALVKYLDSLPRDAAGDFIPVPATKVGDAMKWSSYFLSAVVRATDCYVVIQRVSRWGRLIAERKEVHRAHGTKVPSEVVAAEACAVLLERGPTPKLDLCEAVAARLNMELRTVDFAISRLVNLPDAPFVKEAYRSSRGQRFALDAEELSGLAPPPKSPKWSPGKTRASSPPDAATVDAVVAHVAAISSDGRGVSIKRAVDFVRGLPRTDPSSSPVRAVTDAIAAGRLVVVSKTSHGRVEKTLRPGPVPGKEK